MAASCNDGDAPEPDSGAAYFPLQKGLFQVYDVVETHYSGSADPLTEQYELKAEVVDSFAVAEGGFSYVIHRSRRSTGEEIWQTVETWSARKDAREVVVSEGNTPYVKLRFPLRGDRRWDGNIYNAVGEDEYTAKSVGEAMVLAGMTFENTVTIEQEHNEDRIVFRDERSEVYAKGVGLVRRTMIQLNYCTQDQCLGQQKIESGVETDWVIKSYGRN